MAQNKLSGYQKLKKENQVLKNKLALLVHSPNSIAAMEIKRDMVLAKNIEDTVWAGDTSGKNNEGFIKSIL